MLSVLPGVTIYDASKEHVHGNMFLTCIRNEPKQCINTWQITEVSNSAKRHADNSGNYPDFAIVQSNGSALLKINVYNTT